MEGSEIERKLDIDLVSSNPTLTEPCTNLLPSPLSMSVFRTFCFVRCVPCSSLTFRSILCCTPTCCSCIFHPRQALAAVATCAGGAWSNNTPENRLRGGVTGSFEKHFNNPTIRHPQVRYCCRCDRLMDDRSVVGGLGLTALRMRHPGSYDHARLASNVSPGCSVLGAEGSRVVSCTFTR